MTRQEFMYWVAALQTYYERFDLLSNDQAVDLWYEALGDLDGNTAVAALKKWSQTEHWPPTIADIRKLALESQIGPTDDWGDGWMAVKKAIERYGWCREKEALASLPPAARSAAQRIGWQDICNSENPEALRAQFRQVYEVIAERERTDQLISPGVKQMLADVAGNMKMIGGSS